MYSIPRPSIQEALFSFKPQINSLQELLLDGYNELILRAHYNQLFLVWFIMKSLDNKYRKYTHYFTSFNSFNYK